MLLELQQEVATSNALILKQFENGTDPYSRLFELMEVQAVAAHNLSRLVVRM